MTVLLDERVPGTLDQVTERLRDDTFRGARVEIWVFEGAAQRRAAEERLSAAGVVARVRSAYKPLLHFFLEDVAIADLRRATIRYPVHDAAHGRRFLVEAFPLAALLKGTDARWLPGEAALSYRVELEYRDRNATVHEVFAPNLVREDHLGERTLSPTGWLRITGSRDGAGDADRPLETEFETAFHKVIAAVGAHPWGAQEPYFEQLVIRADIPGAEQRLPYLEECVSTAEALHEDVYFSLLEWFKRRAGRGIDDRTTQPGQIIPDIRYADGAARVRVALEPFRATPPPQAAVPLETADRPLSADQLAAELSALGGRRFSATSRQGRAVAGTYHAGTHPAILVTAGQHANETSGVVGALRAARRLAATPGAHFALIPSENPDGYALHRLLCAQHPRHMHHAARYTALGDDLQSRSHEPLYEKAARLEALQLSGAALHINLHGYPAHEWTRPMSGYLPRGFDLWAVPKGFYLILRHHRAWADRAAAFLARLTERLGAAPGLAAFNRTQLETYRAHAGELSSPVYHDVPCQVVEDDRAPTPLTLITEFPDETIYGELFVFAHTVQMQTVLAAEEIHAALEPGRG
ncbi:MAG TPA: peptidase M14 [bacterium]|nr:peptidase M14 [bacterium]